jgi:RNA polymerase sigma-70 factor, ECF subfamily
MLLNSLVSSVTFRHRLSNLRMWGCRGPVGRQANVARHLREDADVGEDSSWTFHRMHSGENLETLMVRYQQGDFAAASVLIRHISPRLHRFFLAKSMSRADADDLLQETWLRIHKVRHTYRNGEPALPWFYAIARHIRVDHYRKSVRAAAGERELEEMSKGVTTTSHQAGELEALLAPLSESQREVIAMLKVEGMSLEEVARAMSSSVGSVKQKVHRAYKKLRETIGATTPGKWRSGGQA